MSADLPTFGSLDPHRLRLGRLVTIRVCPTLLRPDWVGCSLGIMVNRSVNYNPARIGAVFAALADPTRRGMIARLASGPATMGELGRPYRITKPAVTKHVKVLERAGLVRRRRAGRNFHCTLEPASMVMAQEWIAQQRRFWERSLDRLAAYLDPAKLKGDKG